jgi:hypothetical protein
VAQHFFGDRLVAALVPATGFAVTCAFALAFVAVVFLATFELVAIYHESSNGDVQFLICLQS